MNLKMEMERGEDKDNGKGGNRCAGAGWWV